MLETTHLRPHLEELSEKLWTVISVPLETCLQILQQAQQRRQNKQFRPAALAATQKIASQIRNDEIFWLDAKANDLAEVEKKFLNFIEQVREELKNEFRVSLNEVECHYACYEKGHFYQKHRDTTTQNNRRLFTFVLYLNPDWNQADDGQIVGYDEDKVLFKLQPQLGKMLLFRSDLEHEVRPTLRDRISLTGWFRN